MRFAKIIIIIPLIILVGCNKVRNYQINIINETGLEIQDLELSGTSEYHYAIPKDGETGVKTIQWVGPKYNLLGQNFISLRVKSFSDSTKIYIDSVKCGKVIAVDDLKSKKTNTLKLKYIYEKDTNETCNPHKFSYEL